MLGRWIDGGQGAGVNGRRGGQVRSCCAAPLAHQPAGMRPHSSLPGSVGWRHGSARHSACSGAALGTHAPAALAALALCPAAPPAYPPSPPRPRPARGSRRRPAAGSSLGHSSWVSVSAANTAAAARHPQAPPVWPGPLQFSPQPQRQMARLGPGARWPHAPTQLQLWGAPPAERVGRGSRLDHSCTCLAAGGFLLFGQPMPGFPHI